MRVRPFVRIAGNLSLTTSDLSAKVPAFNAQRMLTDVGSPTPTAADDAQNADAAEPDAEVCPLGQLMHEVRSLRSYCPVGQSVQVVRDEVS